jgi:hypothetical protein
VSWWKSKKKCPLCHQKYKKTVSFHELRLQTADGILELEICEVCADFLDKSAHVLSAGRKKDASDDEPV